MKLVWLAVNASHAHSSLALPLLQSASAAVPEVSWQAVATTSHDDPASLTAAVWSAQPDVVAATLYLFNRRLVLEVLARLRALLPTCTLIVGGPECLGDNRELLRQNPGLDLAVRGEGEAVLPELLRRLLQGDSPAGLAGVCWRDAAGALHDDGSRAVFTAWPEAPPPCANPFYDTTKPFVQVETSRGCTAQCSYCTSGGSAPLRLRPLAAIREELAELRRRGLVEIRLLDRTFNAFDRRACQLLELFLSEFPDLRFHLEIDPGKLGAGLRRLLQAAPPGTLHLEAGLQTTAAAARAAVGRAGTAAAAVEGIRFLCGCAGVVTHVDLLAGLPAQTLPDLEHDLALLLEIGPAEIQLETLKILPGTPLRDQAEAHGLRWSPEPPYDVLSTPDLDVPTVRRVAGWSRLLDGFHNAPDLQPILRRAAALQAGFLPEFALTCQAAGLLTVPSSLERRFRHLHATLAVGNNEIADLVRLGWMQAGMSPADPLAGARPWKTALPADGEWLHGRAELATPGRAWHLPLSSADYWFIYDRRHSPQRPVACRRCLRTPAASRE
jgi:radical SAM superfamily enzyme YgiQ (UPF0313 family)